MKYTLLAVSVASALATSTVALGAQASNALVGKWTIEFERGRRIENGEATPIMGSGKLSVLAQGDSLVATLEAGARPDGTVPPVASFGGRVTPAGAVFVQKQTVQLNMNGEASSREITLTWTLQANGDALSGMLARELPGMPEPLPATPVKGTRVAAH